MPPRPRPTLAPPPVRMIALDLDGTLLASTGLVSPRNQAALHAARAAGIEIVIATGRRHGYAMRQLRALTEIPTPVLPPDAVLISSNGAVLRTIAADLLARSEMTIASCRRLFAHLGELRNALVVTFDRTGPDGEDERGALVIEHLADLHTSIEKWMIANEPFIDRITPIEDSLLAGAPIQMMLCGTIDRMRRAEALLRTIPGVSHMDDTASPLDDTASPEDNAATHLANTATLNASASSRDNTASPLDASASQRDNTANPVIKSANPVAKSASLTDRGNTTGKASQSDTPQAAPEATIPTEITLHRTEYPARDLSIVDILPAGASKGTALADLAATRGYTAANIMAIGDNWNDLPMLHVAGTPVLMGNAPPELLTRARALGWWITRTNEQDGVALAIEAALTRATRLRPQPEPEFATSAY